jgi:RNA-directed DNA polymerase
MEAITGRRNMMKAYEQVVRNDGIAGVDGMTCEALRPYLQSKWHEIKTALLEGRYEPQPVLKVEIPKPDGGMRILGIPTVVDRLIGQAIHQVLEPIFDPTFSESSYGFRRGRNAHQAIGKARQYVEEGRRWVVDIDLEKFFDRVNHDILMARIARRVKDKRLLRVIRKYLQAGIMVDGLETVRIEGTPQGSPLSPLLSNIILDDLDKELERRGHAFCRYADDCNVYVQSHLAGERVMATITAFLEGTLRLKVNKTKSAVDRPWKLKFLGYSMTHDKKPRLRVAGKSVQRLKAKLKEHFRKGRGRSVRRIIEEITPMLRGWTQYFKYNKVKFIFEELDGWIRRKLRDILWRQWKRPYARARNLIKRGLAEPRARQSATNGRGPWWNAGASHMNEAYKAADFRRWGLFCTMDALSTNLELF